MFETKSAPRASRTTLFPASVVLYQEQERDGENQILPQQQLIALRYKPCEELDGGVPPRGRLTPHLVPSGHAPPGRERVELTQRPGATRPLDGLRPRQDPHVVLLDHVHQEVLQALGSLLILTQPAGDDVDDERRPVPFEMLVEVVVEDVVRVHRVFHEGWAGVEIVAGYIGPFIPQRGDGKLPQARVGFLGTRPLETRESRGVRRV